MAGAESKLRVIVFGASAVGIVASGVATLASCWAALGTTPPWVYGRWGALAILTTRQRVADIPIESVGLLWFAAIAWLFGAHARGRQVSWVLLAFASGALMTGLGALLSWQQQLHCIPLNIATVAAAILLCASSSQELPSLRTAWAGWRTELGAALRNPGTRAAVLAGCFVLVAGAEWLHAAVDRVSVDEARERVFVKWFSGQTPLSDVTLRSAGAVRVVIFTDYQCPYCGSQVPDTEATARALAKTSGRTIEVAIRDFPLEPECNAGASAGRHPAACEAAVAVRLVASARGEAAGREMAGWFYEHSGDLSAEAVIKRLADMGLDREFHAAYPELVRQVAADAAYGRRMGVEGTPTVFVDGIKLIGGALMVDAALKYEVGNR